NNDRNVSGETPGTGLQITNSSPTVSNNQFTQNTKALVIESSSAPTVSGNTFSQNTTSAVEVNSSHPTFSSNTASGNGTNGIFLQGSISQNYTLSSNLPFVIQATYSVPATTTLAIDAGTIVKLSGAGNISASGKINALGSSAAKIIFTSLHDDDCGISGGCGDTNATTTTPVAGDWDNIVFNSGAASSTLQYVVVRYGGNNDNPLSNPPRGALRLIGTSIDILNSTIEKNYIAGIWMQNSTSTVISDSIIRDHSDSTSEVFYGINLTSTSTPLIKNTVFSNNETNIRADSTSSYTDGGGNSF
ncbi:MAG: right-handed parallel beta-helix repeat-containing protein, partial [Candidatus Sungbacteria bacterium]|nr:right-handed parallel beta-helix repeat-containing protein [Candidatus Sungbacteria bacterium]